MPHNEAADYADDPADLRPSYLDRALAHLQPLDFLFLTVSPCLLCAPVLFVIAAGGLLACRVPAARRKAWILLLLMTPATAVMTWLWIVPQVALWVR